MGIKIKSLAITLFSASILGTIGCECVGGAYHVFSKKIAFEPERLTYHVGDTIWLTSKFSCKDLLNAETGETEDYCGIENIGLSFKIALLEPWIQDTLAATPGVKYFNFLTVEGSATPLDDRNVDVFFQTQGDEYSLKIGIIPRETGQYVSAVSGGGGYKLPGSKKCDTGSFGFSPDVQDNHIILLETFKKGAQNVTEYERSQVYCFEVVQ